VDLRWIRKLIKVMESANLQEVEVEEEGKKIKLKKAGREFTTPPTVPGPTSPSPAVRPAREFTPMLPEGVLEFTSPMVGTFYRAPSPDSDPFVAKGDTVQPDTLLCILEAMKVMNEIKAEMEGEIVDILVKNGESVEFGQPLFLIKKA